MLLFQAMRGNPLDLGVNFDSVAHWPWASGIWASKNFDVGCVLAAVYAVNPESKNVELAAIFSKVLAVQAHRARSLARSFSHIHDQTVGDETSAWSRSYAYKDLTDFLCFLDGDDGVDWAEEHFGSDWEETLNLSSGDQKVKELVAPQLELLGQALFKTSTWQPEIHYQCATDQHRAAVHTMLKLRLRDPVTGETRMPSTVLHLMPIELMFHLFYYMFFDDVATLQAQAEDAE